MIWPTQPASRWLLPSPQAQIGLQTAPTMPNCAVGAAAVTTAFVTAVEAAVAVAVIDAAGVID